MHSEECERRLSTRRRAERGHGSLYSSECTVCKGEGTAVNDQSDAGRKSNRQTGTCIYIHVEYAHVYTQIIYAHTYIHCTYTSRFRPSIMRVYARATLPHGNICYAGMVQVSHTNARPLGYTGMA